eukprot:scaffold298_cov247-Pinguiococcus_pyrenoidosus.AAC.24
MRTFPTESRPRRPARPAIWVYSPGKRSRKLRPSCFLVPLKTTVRAGMFTPMAKVSVANSTLTRPSLKRISTTSLRIGSRPP